MKILRSLLFCFSIVVLLSLNSTTNAQLPGPIDIMLCDAATAGDLEVKLAIPQTGFTSFDGLVSNIVFTIAWETATGYSLGNVMQVDGVGFPSAQSQWAPIQAPVGEIDDGGMRYQIYASVSLTPMSQVLQPPFNGPVIWMPGDTISLMTVTPTAGTLSYFNITNDAYTGANNGNYYMELQGSDQTGEIVPCSPITGIDDVEAAFTMYPNPASQSFTISLKETGNYMAVIKDGIGRNVMVESFNTKENIDISSLINGIYFVEVTAENDQLVGNYKLTVAR